MNEGCEVPVKEAPMKFSCVSRFCKGRDNPFTLLSIRCSRVCLTLLERCPSLLLSSPFSSSPLPLPSSSPFPLVAWELIVSLFLRPLLRRSLIMSAGRCLSSPRSAPTSSRAKGIPPHSLIISLMCSLLLDSFRPVAMENRSSLDSSGESEFKWVSSTCTESWEERETLIYKCWNKFWSTWMGYYCTDIDWGGRGDNITFFGPRIFTKRRSAEGKYGHEGKNNSL